MSAEHIEHHKQFEFCTTRLKYRQGRQLKAVKVYTVGNESQHLLIFGVPKINLQEELKRKLQRFGEPDIYLRNITKEWTEQCHDLEAFTEVFHVKYLKLEQGRKCKRYLDGKSFYGGVLHISYAPEYETLDELRSKLQKRKSDVKYRNKVNKQHKRVHMLQNNQCS